MRSGFFRRGILGALIGALGAAFGRPNDFAQSHGQNAPPEMPKSNRIGGGHHGSKPHSDSTEKIRARKRWLKKRRRNPRRGVYAVRGPRG